MFDIELIKENLLFEGIEDEQLRQLLTCAKARHAKYKKGDLIFYQDDEKETLYILLKGQVAIMKHLISGKKNILYEISVGQIFGEHCFFEKKQAYQYGAQARTDVEVLELPWFFFHCFCGNACERHRRFVKNMVELLAKKECLTLQKLHVVSGASLKERISIWLLDVVDEDDIVRLKMNREELSNYLGVARPSLSRTLMKMQEEGLIAVGQNQIRILDKKKIEKFI